jgi:hypothetical protein
MPRESALYRKRRNGPGPRGLLKERVVFPAVNYESSWPYYVANTFIEKYVRYYVLVFGPGPDLIDVPEKYKPETVTEVVESVRQLKPETGDQFDPWGCICDMDMMCLPREMLSERCLATYESKTEEKSESGDEDEPDTESDTSGMKVIDHLGNTYLVRNGSYDCCMNELYPNAQELLLKNEWKRPIYCQYPCSGQAFYEDGLKLVSPRMEARNGAWEKSSFSCPYKVTYDCNGPLMKTPGFVTYSNGAVATVYKE